MSFISKSILSILFFMGFCLKGMEGDRNMPHFEGEALESMENLDREFFTVQECETYISKHTEYSISLKKRIEYHISQLNFYSKNRIFWQGNAELLKTEIELHAERDEIEYREYGPKKEKKKKHIFPSDKLWKKFLKTLKKEKVITINREEELQYLDIYFAWHVFSQMTFLRREWHAKNAQKKSRHKKGYLAI